MNDAAKKSPTQALGFAWYAAKHVGVALDTLDGATDRRLYEVARATGERLRSVTKTHYEAVDFVWGKHEGFYATLGTGGPAIIEAYVARCMWERAGHADKGTRTAELELERRKARRAA